jgi:hypothetical protein
MNGGALSGTEDSKPDVLDKTIRKDKERDAIMSLLDFQQQKTSSPGSAEDDVHGNEKALKKPPPTSAANEKPANHHSPINANKRATLRDLVAAQGKVSPPPLQIIPQVFLMDMGKKRKYHPPTEGQFEDALEQSHPHHRRPDPASGAANPPSKSTAPIPNTVVSDSKAYLRPPFNSNAIQPTSPTSVPHQQQLQLLDQQSRERRIHLEQMVKAHLALQQLPSTPAPNLTAGIADTIKPSIATALCGSTDNPNGYPTNQVGLMQTIATSRPTNGVAKAIHPPPYPPAVRQQIMQTLLHSKSSTTSMPITQLIELPERTRKAPAFADTESPDAYSLRRSVQVPTMRPPPTANAGPTTLTKYRYEEYEPPVAWTELTSVPKMPTTLSDDKQEKPILRIGESDVLLGRGGLTNTNPGNIKFRAMVSKFRMAYCTAPKGDKGALARFLCNYVRSKKGMFLRRHEKDKSNSFWYEVGDEKAVLKCGQALREGTAELVKRAAGGQFPSKDIDSYP